MKAAPRKRKASSCASTLRKALPRSPLGDYRTDLAWTRLILRAEDLPDADAAGLRLYEQFAGRQTARLDYFEVLACVRLLLSVLLSLRFGAKAQGMRPEAEALMRQGADHTRYTAALLQKRTGIRMPDLDAALTALFAT